MVNQKKAFFSFVCAVDAPLVDKVVIGRDTLFADRIILAKFAKLRAPSAFGLIRVVIIRTSLVALNEKELVMF